MMVIFGVVLLDIGVARAEPTSKTLSPYFFVESGDDGQECFPLKSTAVQAVINGVIADVTVTQQYANTGTQPINARYIFPAATQAAVHGMRMTVGEEVIVAQIRERKAAQKEFNDAKAAGKSASLLEQERPNVFSMNVANVMPGETVSIELHYSELLVPEEGIYSFVYPTVVGPRYSTIPEAGADDHHQWLKNPYLTSDRKPASRFDLEVTLAAGLPIEQVACNSHKTDVAWEGKFQARVALAENEVQAGNRDFILNYRLSGDQIHTGLMLHQGDEENFFMLMVQPPQRIASESIPPREYILILDVSGSMYGFPLDTAKVLMEKLLSGLRPMDRFNVILFAGGARILAPQSLPAEPTHVQAALKLIDDQEGGGGTELAQALATGLALPHAEGLARTMVIVTDGYIAAEKEVFSLIDEQAGQCNVFAFGIGSSVNRYLIEGLARAGQGEPFVVTDPKEAANVAARFASYIEAPVVTGIEIDFTDFDAYEVEPARPADLFAQRPLIVCGKWRGQPRGMITVKGKTAGLPYEENFDLSRHLPSESSSALPILWARTRLGRLSDFAAADENEETRAQVIHLGLKYHLLTAYTSFVAVHELIRNPAAPAKDVDQPLPLPHNVSNLAVGGHNVPEPPMETVLLVVAAAGLAMAWRRRKQTAQSRS
jgi:Ca-activated chloride channel family protein